MLKTQPKSHRSQQKYYKMPRVELLNFLNDLVTDSSHFGRAEGALAPSRNRGGGRHSAKRPLGNPEVVATMRFEGGEGSCRGRGNLVGRGRTSPKYDRIDFNAIVVALTPQECKRHQEEAPAGGAETPRGGCARMPVGAYLYLHAVGDGNPVAVPSLAR
jgi:hypothetical protein